MFWQIDINGLVRTGKIMCYNPENGHRIKEPQAFGQLGTFRVAYAGFPFETMSIWRAFVERFICISCDAGRE